jgi:hypothetical protein
MVLKTTQWSPDTCGCTFEYTWDDTESEDIRTHNFKTVVKECASHAHLTGNNKKDAYDSSLEENKRKNGTIGELLDKAAADFGELDPNSGSMILKKGITLTWDWTGIAPDRVMNLHVTGITLTQQKKTAAQNFLNNKFGAGKVILQNP